MHPTSSDSDHKTRQENMRRRIQEVKERHKLPSPPALVSKVIHILKDPDFNVRELSRVISDDPSLASRALSLSRSPRYAQRFQPRTVHEAILVLGFQTVRNIVVATAAQSFMSRRSKITGKLWTHSVGAALAARILAKRTRCEDPEAAFLTGLLHDVGEMILFEGDPRGFELIVEEVQQSQESIVEKEVQLFTFDHAAVGVALLDYWNIDEQVSEAILTHHGSEDNPVRSLAAIVDMADYLCARADLGFFGELPSASPEAFTAFDCADEETLNQLVQEVRDAFDQESLFFRAA